MKLCKGIPGEQYEVWKILLTGPLAGRIAALGLNPYTRFVILTKKRSGALIVLVRGTKLALGRKIADGIEIREAGDDGKREA